MLQASSQLAAIERDHAPLAYLRILQVTPTYYPAVRYGGPIRSVHALGKALVERGHEVHVYTSSMDGSRDFAAAEMPATLDGVHVHYFPVPALRRLCWCPSLTQTLKRTAAGFDVMHLHSMFQWPTSAAARVAAAAGLPYLVAPRGMLGQTVIRGKSRWIKTAWIRLIEQHTLAKAAGLHVTTELEAAEIRAVGLQLPNVHCVPNSVSWPAQHAALADGPLARLRMPYVLFLSRIDWKKGLDRLIEAWRWLPELTLIIAGNDEAGYWSEIETMARECGVLANIRFIGPVSDAHKWALYENALLFILPSYSENFGNVVAEAMAMGCPVVVTPEVGLAELVRTSASGVVTDGSPRALAATVAALAANPVQRRALGERGRLTARRYLSADACAAQMDVVYQSICRRPAGERTSRPAK